jgi:hypothetical protein
MKLSRNAKVKRARPRTSRPHKLKDAHYRLWKFYWKRSRVLPDEQYYDFQIAAAKHFGVDQSTISRRLAVLIEHEAVVLVRPTRRSEATGLFTSVVVQPTEPPSDDSFEAQMKSPHAKMHTDEVIEKTGSATACRNASHTVLSTNNPIDIPVSTADIWLTVDREQSSDANLHADQVIEKTPSSPHAGLHAVKAQLGTRILAATQKLTEYENAATNSLKTMGEDCGWNRSAEDQRGVIARLKQELATVEAR